MAQQSPRSLARATHPGRRCDWVRPPTRVLATALLTILLGGTGCSLTRPKQPALGLAGVDQPAEAASQKLDLAICLETAELARKRGMDDEAIAQYLAARRIDPQVRGIAHPLAVLFDRAGRTDAADREYRAALAERGDAADVLCDYGYFLHSRGKSAEAESMLRKALRQQPEHHQATVNLALVVGGRGDYQEAERLFTAAIGPAAALHNIGMLKWKAGDEAGALADLRAAANGDPSLEATRAVIDSLTRRNVSAATELPANPL